jgi:hypothetical protein
LNGPHQDLLFGRISPFGNPQLPTLIGKKYYSMKKMALPPFFHYSGYLISLK